MVLEAISNTRRIVSFDFRIPRNWLFEDTRSHLLFFNPLLFVWKSDEIVFAVFDILLKKSRNPHEIEVYRRIKKIYFCDIT